MLKQPAVFKVSVFSAELQYFHVLYSFVRYMSDKKNYHRILLPTAYLPSLEYMLYVALAKNVVIEIFETYPKQTWRNRCTIMTANGLLNLIIPVIRPAGNRTVTKDVLLSPQGSWHNKHWRAISAAYSNSPYFLYYSDLIRAHFAEEPTGPLHIFNSKLLSAILHELNISANITFTLTYEQEVAVPDLRGEMTPKLHLRKKQPLTEWPEYHQVFSEKHGFRANLSVIDLLFHLGPDTSAYLHEAARLNLPQLSEG